ncbi:MAG: hypothetical protein OEZ01_15130 [Candidatus Heimdallarchaeota archaeon]|nr:hypothetical protein [Candidatus Heimdallarchaeota archaeon]
MIYRIFNDLNSITKDDMGDKIHLYPEGSRQLSEFPFSDQWKPGTKIIIWEGSFQVEGELEFDEGTRMWFARPDWSTQRDLTSAVEGIEDYIDADPVDKLAILKYETGLQFINLRAVIEGLKMANISLNIGGREMGNNLVEDLTIAAHNIQEIIHKLTEPK